MKRRDFITAAATVAATTGFLGNTFAQEGRQRREGRPRPEANRRAFIEWRVMYTKDAAARDSLVNEMDEILLPIRKELGFEKTGIFTLNIDMHNDSPQPKYENAVFILTSSSSMQAFVNLDRKTIAKWPKDAFRDQLENEDTDCSLLYAFADCPDIEVPTLSPERILQYRHYWSPNIERNQAKLKMFDIRGELKLFREVGIAPVFFGETLFGQMMPNIAYMASFENDAARKKGWEAFVNHDEWNKMKNEEEFKNTATRIVNLFLKPSPKSEI